MRATRSPPKPTSRCRCAPCATSSRLAPPTHLAPPQAALSRLKPPQAALRRLAPQPSPLNPAGPVVAGAHGAARVPLVRRSELGAAGRDDGLRARRAAWPRRVPRGGAPTS
eukprot:scaffold35670_cov56-Phaeocystis_antarctica.AAC.4